jgi:hypothetical protein
LKRKKKQKQEIKLGSFFGREKHFFLSKVFHTNFLVTQSDQYMATYTIMKPEVQRVQALQDFVQATTSTFIDQVRALARAAPNSDAFNSSCNAIVRLVDIMVVANFLKMFNSFIMNDFAMFKR